MLVTSPRCSLNCNGLSMHLPPLERPTYGSDYISPPMSASYSQTKFDDHISGHINTSNRSNTKASYHSSSKKGSVGGSSYSQKSVAKAGSNGVSITANGNGNGSKVISEWADDYPPNVQDSPEGQLVPGPPGIARRAKAHVPSACVNCKKKHLACETKRPCNRCIQNGKEVSLENPSAAVSS